MKISFITLMLMYVYIYIHIQAQKVILWGLNISSKRKLYKPPEFVTQNREAVLNQPELLCSSARMLLSPNTVLLQNKPSTACSLEKRSEESKTLF
jgi:hypothetical protein